MQNYVGISTDLSLTHLCTPVYNPMPIFKNHSVHQTVTKKSITYLFSSTKKISISISRDRKVEGHRNADVFVLFKGNIPFFQLWLSMMESEKKKKNGHGDSQ